MGKFKNDEHPIQELSSIAPTDRSGVDVNVKDRWGDPIIATAVRKLLNRYGVSKEAYGTINSIEVFQSLELQTSYSECC